MLRTGKAPTELAQIRLDLQRKHGKSEYSQVAVAEKVSRLLGEDITQAALSAWERMEVNFELVLPRRLRAYAQALEISPATLERILGFRPGQLFNDGAEALAELREQAPHDYTSRTLHEGTRGDFPIPKPPPGYRIRAQVDLKGRTGWLLTEAQGREGPELRIYTDDSPELRGEVIGSIKALFLEVVPKK